MVRGLIFFISTLFFSTVHFLYLDFSYKQKEKQRERFTKIIESAVNKTMKKRYSNK